MGELGLNHAPREEDEQRSSMPAVELREAASREEAVGLLTSGRSHLRRQCREGRFCDKQEISTWTAGATQSEVRD
jgi:hypothetical protein